MIDVIQPSANPIVWASHSLRPILPQIAIAITSTFLAIFGNEINVWFKNLVKKRPFVIRVAVFVLLVAFGYGALTLGVSRLVSQMLMKIDDIWLSPLVVGVFIGLGILAEERRQI